MWKQKKQLIPLLFERLQPLDISSQDLEITIFETPISTATGR
ncbi:hypothetical protein [Anabaena sp. AL93]|nr:hypothetical protein [Anabaena sp. AL93]